MRRLTKSHAFSITNPNRVYALIGAFANANPTSFNAADGAGYQFVAEKALKIDDDQSAGRRAASHSFRSWRNLEAGRRALARAALENIAERREPVARRARHRRPRLGLSRATSQAATARLAQGFQALATPLGALAKPAESALRALAKTTSGQRAKSFPSENLAVNQYLVWTKSRRQIQLKVIRGRGLMLRIARIPSQWERDMARANAAGASLCPDAQTARPSDGKVQFLPFMTTT